jgi:glycosyltransferase involved in cell wall biosynthesis
MHKVTVAVCNYRQGRWLYRCLRSLAAQTLRHSAYEVIVVNDDPEEDIREIVEVFQEDGILNVRLLQNSRNLGVPSSLNLALRRARGQYFVRVDADDYVSRHFLRVLSLFLDMNRDFQAVSCDYVKIDEVGRTISRHRFEEEPIACGVMFTYESLANIGFYDEQFRMREGHELLARFTQRYRICHLPFPLYRYRMHGENRTRDAEQLRRFEELLSQRLAEGRTREEKDPARGD